MAAQSADPCENSRPSAPFHVRRLIPMLHVADVDASIAFYALLGFTPTGQAREPDGRSYWAKLDSAAAELMLARASDPVVPSQQAALLYLYCPDVVLLRHHLLKSGIADGGDFCGGPSAVSLGDPSAVSGVGPSDDSHTGPNDASALGRRDGARGGPGPTNGRAAVFKVTYPDYMERGELRVHDPDGYCLLIGRVD